MNKRQINRKLKRMTFAATNRCPCGFGLAHFQGKTKWHAKDGPGGYWDCSGIILGIADSKVQHTAKLPFVFYEIKSEFQPSANGVTTRPTLDEVMEKLDER